MSLLTVIQSVCARTNVPVPTTVMGAITDTQILQMLKLLEEEGKDLAKRGPWQGLTQEATFSTVATESQGAIATLASNGFNYIKNKTFWDRSTRLPILGPLSDDQWATLKGLTTTGMRYAYRIRGGLLLVNPVPSVGLSWAFEYLSNNWILGIDGTTYKSSFTLDTDTILLNEDLVTQGLRWRWKKEKGLEYAEDFRTYETQVQDALGRDGGKPTLWMDNGQRDSTPGIFIPDRGWNVP